MKAYESDDISAERYPFMIAENNGVYTVILKELIASIADDLCRGTSQSKIAALFHNTVAGIIRDMCLKISEKTNIHHVALSGGTFQNRLLMRKVVPLLESSGLAVLTHRQVPCNDGGISVGQAVAGNFH